jgi:hypothetical protein
VLSLSAQQGKPARITINIKNTGTAALFRWLGRR